MLVSLDGRMGQGKTAAMTALGVMEYKRTGCKIFSTYHLNDVIQCPTCGLKHPLNQEDVYQCGGEVREVNGQNVVERIPYTFINLEIFYNIFKAADQGSLILSDCLFLLDEAYLFLDARHSGSRINRLFNTFIFQTRKRGVDMYITSHDIARIDKRIRAGLDLRIRCRYSPATQIITLRIRDMHTGDRRGLRIYGPVAAFPYFNTDELVKPQGKLYTMKEEELK